MNSEERILLLLETLVTDVKEIKVSVAGLESRLDKLESRMDSLESRMDKLEARMDRLEAEVAEIKSELPKLEKRLLDKIEQTREEISEKEMIHIGYTLDDIVKAERRILSYIHEHALNDVGLKAKKELSRAML